VSFDLPHGDEKPEDAEAQPHTYTSPELALFHYQAQTRFADTNLALFPSILRSCTGMLLYDYGMRRWPCGPLVRFCNGRRSAGRRQMVTRPGCSPIPLWMEKMNESTRDTLRFSLKSAEAGPIGAELVKTLAKCAQSSVTQSAKTRRISLEISRSQHRCRQACRCPRSSDVP
jgi:hypothetical protein